MSPQSDYDALKSTFAAIPEEEFIKRPNSPAKIIADGNAQLVVAKQDSEELTSEGMDAGLITDVEQSLDAYSWISSLYDTAVIKSNSKKEELATTKELGYDVRKELFRYGKFGCNKNNLPEVGAELDEIMEGIGDDDMIYDLLRCNRLFTAHPEVFDGLLKFDPNWVSQSLELHNKLTKLKAEVKNPDAEELINQYETEARQAYTHYHKKVYELREWGEFVFEGDERSHKYKAQFKRKN